MAHTDTDTRHETKTDTDTAPRQETQSSDQHSSPPGSGGAEVYNWWIRKQVVSCAFHHLCCLPLEQLEQQSLPIANSQLLAKESKIARPNWIEHTKDN